MCRLAAYIGLPISLAQFLLKPPHSLVKQAFAPREMREAKLNADGYGFGWYDPQRAPVKFSSVMPIWGDANLPALGSSLQSDVWVANVRSATPGLATSLANTQPFMDDEFLFLHNGFVTDFGRSLRGYIRTMLEPDIEAGVHGNTDSEYLFALLRQILAEDIDMSVDEGINELVKIVGERLEGRTALLNLILTDGERIYAVRHAVNGECPSLYFTGDDEHFGDGYVVASEPLTDPRTWQAVPPHHLLVLEPARPPELLPL